MKKSVKEIKPFDIQLKGTGVFPSEEYIRVIWIGIKNGALIKEIAHKIDDQISKLGFETEKRRFSPHLTIGRIKYPQPLSVLTEFSKKNPFPPCKFFVKEYVLMRSTLTPKGSIYTPICRYFLDISHK